MKFQIIAAAFVALASPAAADSVFGQIGLGGSVGTVFSGSETGSSSRTETWGNGKAEHSALTGATNLSRVTLGAHGGGGNLENRIETFTQGETFSQSQGSNSGGAFGSGSGFGDQRGNAFGTGASGMISGFGGFRFGN